MIPPFIDEEVSKRGTPEQQARAKRRLRLAAQLRARRQALTGSQTPGTRTRKTYTADQTETLPGRLVRNEEQPATGDPATDEAHAGAGDTWRLYKDRFSRDSLNDGGLVLISTVHYGRDFDNAFWDGEQMAYGDGDLFNRFTADPTVIGHELTHGVTQFSAGLIYQGQPGALNEHISDVFGALMEQLLKEQIAETADWLIGAELFAGTGLKGRGLRDMRNPGTAYDDPLIGKDPQPAHMRDYVETRQDNGGVHINSGIPNRAFYLAAFRHGGSSSRGAIGRVWYNVLTGGQLRSEATFQQFADLTVAQDEASDIIRQAWADVGITVGAPSPPEPPTDPSPCGSFLRLPFAQTILSDPQVERFLLQATREARRLRKE